jgi:hypothetical protein
LKPVSPEYPETQQRDALLKSCWFCLESGLMLNNAFKVHVLPLLLLLVTPAAAPAAATAVTQVLEQLLAMGTAVCLSYKISLYVLGLMAAAAACAAADSAPAVTHLFLAPVLAAAAAAAGQPGGALEQLLAMLLQYA